MFFAKIPALMGWAFTLIYAALWALALYFAVFSIPKALSSYGWEETKATVKDNQLSKTQRTHSRTHKIIRVFTAKLTYEYTVGSQSYEGTTKKMAEHAKDGEKIHQKMLEQYPIGSNLTVYYNPAKPEQSIMQKGFNSLHLLLSVMLIGGLGWFTTLILSAAKS